MKLGNASGAKDVARRSKCNMKKLEPYSEMGDSGRHREAEQDPQAIRRALIAVKARNNPKEQFNNLMHHLTPELVGSCLAKMPLKSAPGLDGMTVGQAEKNLAWLLPPILKQVHQGKYEAPSVRRVFIPKATGGQRPLGVPNVLDRALQGSVAKILNEIYEQDFLKCSFGFRPQIGCHHALATVSELIGRKGMNYALEVDIRDFFGSLKHDWLRKFLNLRIGDPRVLKLIDSWLKAGVMVKDRWQETVDGTPQGGSISPLLANIYLHYVLDLWWDKRMTKRLKGRGHLVRYCDDFVILLSKPEDIETVKGLLKVRLEQFGLTIAEEKTHTTNLTPRHNTAGKERRRITFLGFTIYRSKNRKGTGLKTVFKTESKRFTRAKEKLKEKIHKVMHHPVEAQAAAINSMLIGHYNYYGLAGNLEKMHHLWHLTRHFWRRSLSRRSQRGKISWAEFEVILEKNPLKTPRLKIPYSLLSSYVRL